MNNFPVKRFLLLLLAFFLFMQAVAAIDLTKLWLIKKDTGDIETMRNRVLPEFSSDEQINLLFEFTDAKLSQNTGDVSWSISFYTNGELNSRLDDQHYSPEIIGNNFTHWRVLNIPIPETPGVHIIELTITDHVTGLKDNASATYYVKNPDGTAPYQQPPSTRNLNEILTSFGLNTIEVTKNNNNILVEYNCGEVVDYEILFNQFVSIIIQSAFANPDTGYIVVIPKVSGIPVVRTWAVTDKILDFAVGEVTFSTFYRESVHADFSVFKGTLITGNSFITPNELPGDREASASGNFLLYENFDTNNRGWFTDEEIILGDGKYLMDPALSGRLSFLPHNIPDGEITVKTYLKEGLSDAGFGLIFRVVNSANFYYFLIADLGYFTLGFSQDNVYTTLIPWTQTDAVISKEGNPIVNVLSIPNTLTIRMMGDKIIGIINEEEVFSIVDSTFGDGGIGFLTSSNSAVEFDNLEVILPEVIYGNENPAVLQLPAYQEQFDRKHTLFLGERELWSSFFNSNLQVRQEKRIEMLPDIPGTDTGSIEKTLSWITAKFSEVDEQQLSSTVDKLLAIHDTPQIITAGVTLLNWGALLIDKTGPFSAVIPGTVKIVRALAGMLTFYAYNTQAGEVTDYNFEKCRILIREILVPHNSGKP